MKRMKRRCRPHWFLAGLALLLTSGLAMTAPGAPAEAGLKARADRERLLAHVREHGAEARSLLFEALLDPRASIRRVAAHLLVQIGEPAAEELLAAFNHPDVEIRRIAAYGFIEQDLTDVLWAGALRNVLPWDAGFLGAHHLYLAHIVNALPPEQRTVALRGLAHTLSELDREGVRPFRRFLEIVREQQTRRPSRRSLQWAGSPGWQRGFEPIAFWAFGRTRENRVPDLSGNGFHLRVVSADDVQPEVFDHALRLTTNVHVEGEIARALGEGFTLDMWIRAEDIAPRDGFARWRRLLQFASESTEAGLSFRLNVDRLFVNQSHNTGAQLSVGEWQRLTLVWDRQRISVYVDGEPTWVREEPYESAFGPVSFSIGPMSRGMVIQVEEVAFYPYALSPGEVALNIDMRAGLEVRPLTDPEPSRARRAAPAPVDDESADKDAGGEADKEH